MSITPKTITKIVSEIARLHDEILSSATLALRRAIEIGGMLTEVKAQLEHGDWMPWTKNLPFSERTCRNYMRVYENRDALNRQPVSDLTEAYRMLTDEKPKLSVPIPQPPKRQPIADLDLESPEKEPVSHPREEQNACIDIEPSEPEIIPAVKPKGPVDDMGLPIPEACQSLWNRKPEVSNWISLVVNVRNTLRGVQESDDKLFVKISPQKIIAALDDALADLRALEPYAVCKCLGKGSDRCGLCKGTGLLSHFYWKTVDEETRNMRLKLIESYAR